MPENELKKIAFIAMPFGKKDTGITSVQAPLEVDFDLLWARAIQPALEALGYYAIRADAQTNSVILQDMHRCLVHADLVIGDISVNNANVYYEIGVRHAARSDGCVLISASWARPDFDLRQIRQVRYPMPGNVPSEDDYRMILQSLVEQLPAMVDAEGPVHALTDMGREDVDIHVLLNAMEAPAAEFRQQMRAAELRAELDDTEPLRALMQEIMQNDRLPDYVYREFLVMVRDCLDWGTVLTYIEALPEAITATPFMQEQRALALGNMGDKLTEAIAALEELINVNGESPELHGLLGGRYRRLRDVQKTPRLKTRCLNSAINHYEKGMMLDLNAYYCSCNLPLLYLERGLAGDSELAADVSSLVVAACQRARELNNGDEYLKHTLLVNAFFQQNLTYATELVGEIERSDIVSWKIASALQNIDISLKYIDIAAEKTGFERLAQRLGELVNVPA